MVSLKDATEVIKMLGDVVKSTREIINAVKDGKKFLALNYPKAQQDFSDLIGQMQQTIEGLAKVTSVISSFRFVTDSEVFDRMTANSELARFNNYIIKQTVDITALRNNIRQLRADCEKVRQLRDKLDAFSINRSWGSLFGLLGEKARERSSELHRTISSFYADDQKMVDLFIQTLDLIESGIRDIGNILGPPGTSDPYKVSDAAAFLGIFSLLFNIPNMELHKLADIMSEVQSFLIIANTN
jgi:hypothetical protein